MSTRKFWLLLAGLALATPVAGQATSDIEATIKRMRAIDSVPRSWDGCIRTQTVRQGQDSREGVS